jgi:hypothetical protein
MWLDMGKTYRNQNFKSFKYASDSFQRIAKEKTRRKNKGMRQQLKNELFVGSDRVYDMERNGHSASELQV